MSKTKNRLPRAERETWDVEDVCEELGCSRPHVYKLNEKQGLPHARYGTLLRYRRDDVLKWKADQVVVKKKGAA